MQASKVKPCMRRLWRRASRYAPSGDRHSSLVASLSARTSALPCFSSCSARTHTAPRAGSNSLQTITNTNKTSQFLKRTFNPNVLSSMILSLILVSWQQRKTLCLERFENRRRRSGGSDQGQNYNQLRENTRKTNETKSLYSAFLKKMG